MLIQALESNIDKIATAIERLCSKVETQAVRLDKLEATNHTDVEQKLDKLLSINLRISENLERIAVKLLDESFPCLQAKDTPSHVSSFKSAELVTVTEEEPALKQESILKSHRKKSAEFEKGFLSEGAMGASTAIIKEESLETSLLQRKLPKQALYDIFRQFIVKPIEDMQPESMKEFHRYIGDFYNERASFYYQQYLAGHVTYEDLKVRFSTEIFSQLIEFQGHWIEYLLKFSYDELGKNHLKGKKFYQLFNESSVEALRFLIHKYPPSRTNLIDTELSEKIQETKGYSVVKYDLLKNAGMEIGLTPGQTDFSKEIKRWLNRLIQETRKQYPLFKQTMKSIFSGSEGSLDGTNRDSDVQYAISAKIPQNCQTYSQQQINSPGLTVKNPQLLRILIKWYEQLIVYFTNPEDKIFSNKFGFKSLHAKSIPIRIPQSKLELLARNLRQIYEQEIKQTQRREHFNIGVFIEGLISMSIGGIEGYEFVNEKEITISKMSQYLYEMFKSNLLVFLNLCLEKLVEVRGKYPEESIESNIQLITCGIMDILRCRCIGSKQEIYRIYHEIIKNTDYFEIIRIKNKLTQPTKDILINLKLKKSFLICEVQLALGSSKQQVNDHFCHYLYELERSQFGVLFECASQIYNLDPKIEYVKKHPKINFRRKTSIQRGYLERIRVTDGIECNRCHPYTRMAQIQNTQPFICLCCMSFIPAYFNKLPAYKCNICSFTICHECSISLASKNQEMLRSTFRLNVPSGEILSEGFYYPEFKYPGVYSRKEVEAQCLELLQEHEYVLLCIIDNMRYQYGVFKKYQNTITQTFTTVPAIPQISVSHTSLKTVSTLVPLRGAEVRLVSELNEYRKVHIAYPWCGLESILEDLKIRTVVCIVCHEKKVAFLIDVMETEEEIFWFKQRQAAKKIVRDMNRYKGSCLEVTSKRLNNLDFLREVESKEAISTLNLWENEIEDIGVLEDFNNIEELYLEDNRIQVIEPLLHLSRLQILNVSSNKVKGELPKLTLPQLQYLMVENNAITSISNLLQSNVRSLLLLKLSQTLIEKLPKLSLPKLEFIKADHCRINDISQFAMSELPLMNKLNLEHNELWGEFPRLNFPALSVMKLCWNRISSIEEFVNSNLPALSTLSFAHNAIEGEVRGMKFYELEELNLSFNQLTGVREEVLNYRRLPKLTLVDLRHNQIQGTVPNVELPLLRKLDLGQNNISVFKSFKMDSNPQLQEILIDRNIINHALAVRKHSNLRLIDFSNNLIPNISALELWRTPRLLQLRLNNNVITSSIPKLYMSNLRQLNLSHNQITSEELTNGLHLIPHIESIDLSSNPPQLQEGILQRNKLQDIKCILFS